MQRYTPVTNDLGALALLLLVAMVLTRTLTLRVRGIQAAKFGATDKSDFLIPPFALFYIYLVFAGALHWPSVARGALFASVAAAWLGVACCAAGVVVMLCALASFGTSFRIGIDEERPDRLVTTGIFSLTRNPIYVAFAFVLAGEFLILPNWLLLLYLVAGVALFHRQVLREERFLAAHYGQAYAAYRARVHRYL